MKTRMMFSRISKTSANRNWFDFLTAPAGKKCKFNWTLKTAKTHSCWLQLSLLGVMMMNRSSFTCCCSIPPERFRIDGNPGAAITANVLAAAISPVATLENALVLVSFWRTPSLLTPANVLLISLAMTDLVTGLLSAPLFVILNIGKLIQDEGLFCKVTPVFFLAANCLGGISLLTMTAISVERYTALRVHLRYNEVVTMRRVCVVTVGIWLVCISVAVAAIASTIQVMYVASVTVIPLCLAATAFCYIKIHRVVRRHQAQVSAQIPGQITPRVSITAVSCDRSAQNCHCKILRLQPNVDYIRM